MKVNFDVEGELKRFQEKYENLLKDIAHSKQPLKN